MPQNVSAGKADADDDDAAVAVDVGAISREVAATNAYNDPSTVDAASGAKMAPPIHFSTVPPELRLAKQNFGIVAIHFDGTVRQRVPLAFCGCVDTELQAHAYIKKLQPWNPSMDFFVIHLGKFAQFPPPPNALKLVPTTYQDPKLNDIMKGANAKLVAQSHAFNDRLARARKAPADAPAL